MKDCAKELRKYHNEKVTLPSSERKEMRERRDTNRERLCKGLSTNNQSTPEEHVIQGSYAMRTMVQHADKDYDIDDGALFCVDDLKGPRGGDMSPGDVKQMVADALKDKRFKLQPEVLKNCVRVYYDEGYHIDVPVYRQAKDAEDTVLELASSEWKKSDPRGVTNWFNTCLKRRQFYSDDDDLRRVVRYLKFFARSRSSWNMPSGFILTVLADECLRYQDLREDEMLRETMRTILSRLESNLVVNHPVLTDETITHTNADACMTYLRDKIKWALDELAILDDRNCTKKAALKAWNNVFYTDFFDRFSDDDDDDDSGSKSSFVIGGSKTPDVVDKRGGGKYA